MTVETVVCNSNYGSAGGYYIGIRRALESSKCDSELLVLLDDDNHIVAGRFDAVGELLSLDDSACLLHREMPTSDLNARIGSVMYIDVFDRFARKIYRRPTPETGDMVAYAPYGGLIISGTFLKNSGILPRPELLLYEDDTDFTYRLTRAGLKISTASASQLTIVDADSKWSSQTEGNTKLPLVGMVKARDHERQYYSVRNRIYFDWTRAEDSLPAKARFAFNLWVYSTAILVGAIGAFRLKSAYTFFVACRDGFQAELPRRDGSMLGLQIFNPADYGDDMLDLV
ncbi:hypothetical protein [Gordonia sp. NPDC003376]